jgi:hypothetical protein
MTDAGLMGKASIDWEHLDATDSAGELGSLINLARARPRGFHVSAAADEIFEVEEKLTGRCVCHGTGAGASMAAGEADRRADAVGVEERSVVRCLS